MPAASMKSGSGVRDVPMSLESKGRGPGWLTQQFLHHLGLSMPSPKSMGEGMSRPHKRSEAGLGVRQAVRIISHVIGEEGFNPSDIGIKGDEME